MKKKVVLAFSGGLDTSFCAIYLAQSLDLEVHTAVVQTGGFSEQELTQIEERAKALGTKSHCCIDESQYYYDHFIKYLVFGNVLKNNTYPLSVSAERVSQATAIAHYAKKLKADYIAHGSTGAGNDQVRFDMIFNTVCPEVGVLTPIRELKLSRDAEIDFLKKNGFDFNFEKSAYSINKGIWGTSVGGKETLTSDQYLPESAWPTQVTKHESEKVTLSFEKGELKRVNGMSFDSSYKAINALEEIAGPYGIGRDIHVGDTIIGIKGRVGFEAAAPLIIIKAHHTLEKHVLTKWQLNWKDQLGNFYGGWLHEGQYHDPIMRNIEAFLTDTQKVVTGDVFVELHPYRFMVLGIQSEHDLMQSKFGSYGEMNNSWTGEDVKGFSKIFGNQVMIYNKVNGK